MRDCPMCPAHYDTLPDLERHVESHFTTALQQPALGAAATPPPAACRQCGARLDASELASHEMAHQLEEEELQLAAGHNDEAARVAGEALDAQTAAALAGALDAEAAAALATAEWAGHASDDDATHQQQLEELYFDELRARYGFTAPVRAGCCRLCGEEGHWAADCPKNPDRQEAQRRVIDPPLPRRIAAAQLRAAATPMPGGASLVGLLAACLEQQQVPGSAEYRAGLCGNVQHFGASQYCSGWGCGYNNMQTMASHLLAARPEARQVLFGGAGWVPDIPALQAWLEAAWRAGFDVAGAEQLGRRVQGTKKWVGTTECAAMLRSFGLRAQICDFGVPRAGAGTLAAATAGGQSAAGRAGAAVGVHPGVECDGCGQCPIVGDRFKSQARPNYDLCAACHATSEAAAAGPYSRMLPGALRLPAQQQAAAGSGGGAPGAAGGGMRERLLLWVWKYFMAEDGAQPASSAASAAAARSGAADAEERGGRAGQSKRARLAPRVHLSGKPPLYFQHEGHSRTIVGIERRLVGRERRAEHTLLVLDGGTPGAKLASALQQRSGWQRLLKRGGHTLRCSQYQLLFVQPGLASGAELEALKLVAATERYS